MQSAYHRHALQAAPQQLQDSRTEAAQLKEAARLNDAELEGIFQRQADSSPVGAAFGNLVTAVGSVQPRASTCCAPPLHAITRCRMH